LKGSFQGTFDGRRGKTIRRANSRAERERKKELEEDKLKLVAK
jgi:hypothetical protein